MEILIFILFAALIIGGAIYKYYRGEQRKQELSALAARHGWRFNTGHDAGMEDRLTAFTCLQQGSDRYAYNILEGPDGDRQVCGFDYHYETHSTDSKGNRTTSHHYFSALVVEVDLPLKPLLIRPESFFDKIGELFGFDDIDFESHEFSRRFCVKAADRRWAFDVVHQATMEFLLAAPQFTIQMAGRQVMAYREGLFSADQFDEALQVIGGIVDRLPTSVRKELKGVDQ